MRNQKEEKKTVRQLDLFLDLTIPEPAQDKEGVLAVRKRLAQVMTLALQACGKTREAVADEMARLTGDVKCSVHMLNAFLAASREGWEMSFQRAVAFDQATGTHALLEMAAELEGGKVFYGKDALLASLGRAEIVKDQLNGEIRGIKKRMGEGK